ncbi:MAG: Ig-like domain-containing protein [Candidatus Methanoperedens sp.]
MKRRNLSLGLAILLTALILVQGAMAYPTYNTACDGCHAYPPTTISITPNITTINVNPGQAFAVGLTWAGGNSSGVTAIKWPSVQNNDLFSPNPVLPIDGNLASGTTSSVLTAPSTTGTYVVRVFAARKGPMETDHKDITIIVTAPAPVLTTITVSPATANIIVGANQSFTAAPKDQNGNPTVVAISWTSSNTTVGNVDATGKFTAIAAGTTTVKAANGTVNGTATVTVSTSPLPAKYYIVTFIVTDNVTGKPIKDAKVWIDGVKKETNRSGIVVFNKVSPGNHTYKLKSKHYTKIKESIEVGANMTIYAKLVPSKEKHEEKDDNEHHDKESDNKNKNKLTEKKHTDKKTDKEDD